MEYWMAYRYFVKTEKLKLGQGEKNFPSTERKDRAVWKQCPPTAMSTYSPWYFGTKKYLLSAFEMNVYFWKFIINSKHIIVLLYQVPYKKWSSNSAVLYNSLLIVHVILECLYIFICRINCCVKHGVLWQLTYIHDTCTYTEHSDNMMLPPSHSSAKTHSRE